MCVCALKIVAFEPWRFGPSSYHAQSFQKPLGEFQAATVQQICARDLIIKQRMGKGFQDGQWLCLELIHNGESYNSSYIYSCYGENRGFHQLAADVLRSQVKFIAIQAMCGSGRL